MELLPVFGALTRWQAPYPALQAEFSANERTLAAVYGLQRDGVFRTSHDAQPTRLTRFSARRERGLLSVRPHLEPAEHRQCAVFRLINLADLEHVIRADFHAVRLTLAATALDYRREAARRRFAQLTRALGVGSRALGFFWVLLLGRGHGAAFTVARPLGASAHKAARSPAVNTSSPHARAAAMNQPK